MAKLLFVRTGNDGADADVLIADLGFTIPTGAGWTLLSESSPNDADGNAGQFTARDIRNSADLFDLISGGSLEWASVSGVEELAADYRADYMLFEDFTDDHGRFARLNFPSGPTVPADADGEEGEVFWDSDDDALWAHDGASWILLTSPSGADHGGLTGLDDDDHLQYLLLSGNAARNTVSGKIEFEPGVGELGLPNATDVPGTFTSGDEGDIAWDSDDDCLYLHTGTSWQQVLCVTDSGIEFPNINIDHGELDGLGDDDHPQYGHLLQNEIVSGVWTFDSSGDTDPALIIDPDAAAPTTNLTDGAVSIIDDILSTYDATRGKWLSVDRIQLSASKKGGANDVYLRVNDQIATSETGYRVMRDATITALAAQTDGSETWTLRIRRNDSTTNIASLVVTAAAGNQATNINVDLDQGDELQIFADTTGVIHSPVALVELAWRN
jgi:hypothetical protein